MDKKDGMNYAPKGKPNPVVNKGEFVFAAIGLDHGHIYGMSNGLLEAGHPEMGLRSGSGQSGGFYKHLRKGGRKSSGK